MKNKGGKVPLYQINLDVKSNEAKNGGDGGQQESNRSSNGGGNRCDTESVEGLKFKAETSSVNQHGVDSAYHVFENLGSESQVFGQEQSKVVKDQDTEPKHMVQNRSEMLEDNNSNFSLDSIPSENDQNDDEKDEKLKGHTTSRLPARNVVKTHGSGISNYRWSRQSQGNLNGDNNSSNYLHTMENYQDSEDMDMTMAQGDQGSYSNQIMLTEGFPTGDVVGNRASSLIEMKFKRDSFEQGEQHAYFKGSQIRNPREYMVKKSQINLVSQQDNTQGASNTRTTQKYPTMFKYLCNLHKAGGGGGSNQSAVSEKKFKKSFKNKYAVSGSAQPMKNGSSPSRYMCTESSIQNSSRRKAGKMISQITIEDDETHKVVTDDEQDQSIVQHGPLKTKGSKKTTSEFNFAKSLAFQHQDSSYRYSDPKRPEEEISIRVSKIVPSESAKERKESQDQRVSVLKEEDALNDTIDEIGTLNISNKPKTHRSKCSSDFKKSLKMQPSQIIKKSNVQIKTPVMILKIDLQKNQKPQLVTHGKQTEQSQNSSQSPVRIESKTGKTQQQHVSKHEGLRISTDVIPQSLKRLSRKKSQEKKLSRENSGKNIKNEKFNKSFGNKESKKGSKNDNSYQLDVNFDKANQYPIGSFAAMKKSQSKEDIKINIQKVKESQQLQKIDKKEFGGKETKKNLEPQLQINLNSFKNKKKSDCIQYTEKRDLRLNEKKCLFPTSGLQQSDKKIRQNNSCQNIHNHSNYLQGNKIIQDVQKIKQINLNSSRHHKIQKSSLERIVGQNECLKLFDTMEKIRKTPTFHVKTLSLRKQSDQSNNNNNCTRQSFNNQQRAMTSRQNTDGLAEEDKSNNDHSAGQYSKHDDYNHIEVAKKVTSKNAHTYHMQKEAYLNQHVRKKSQSPCAIPKTKKSLFIFSSEEINVARKSPIEKLNRTKLNNQSKVNAHMSGQLDASANQGVKSSSRQNSKDNNNLTQNNAIKRVNVRFCNSQQSQNQSGLNLEIKRDSSEQQQPQQQAQAGKRIGQRTKSLKQFILQQKKQLSKARKEQSLIDEDEIKIGDKTTQQIQAEHQQDLAAGSAQDKMSHNMDVPAEYTAAVNEIKASKELSKAAQTSCNAPLSPPKKTSLLKSNEKRGSHSKKVVQIDLNQQDLRAKKHSRNSIKDGYNYLKISQTTVTTSQQKQSAQDNQVPYQDLIPIVAKDDKLSKSSSMSNVLTGKRGAMSTQKSNAGFILIDGESQQMESQDEDPIEQPASGMPRNSELSSSQVDNAASTSQMDMSARHSDIERQVHHKIKQILQEYRDALDDQEKEKIQLMLQNSAEQLIQAEYESREANMPLQFVGFSSQESLKGLKSSSSVIEQQPQILNRKRKTNNNIQLQSQVLTSNVFGSPLNPHQQKGGIASAAKKERLRWSKKIKAEEIPNKQVVKQKNEKEIKKQKDHIQIDLRNQLQLSIEKRQSVLSSGPQPNQIIRTNSEDDFQHFVGESVHNKGGRQSSVEFFLTQSNGGVGTAGEGSRILLNQVNATEGTAENLKKSSVFSANSLKSPSNQSNIGQQALMQLKKQLDKIAQSIDTGEEGDLETDANQGFKGKIEGKTKKQINNAEKLLKRKKKKDKMKKQGVNESHQSSEKGGAFTPRQNPQQFGYYLNLNDGQVNFVPISNQISQSQQRSANHQFPQQQFKDEVSFIQPHPMELSGMPPHQIFPSAQQQQQYHQMMSQQPQQQQIVWMPVPISHMTPYSQGGMPAPAMMQPQQQQIYTNPQPMTSGGNLIMNPQQLHQTPMSMPAPAPLLQQSQNPIQIQPFVTGPTTLVGGGGTPTTYTAMMPGGQRQVSPHRGVAGHIMGQQQSLFTAQEQLFYQHQQHQMMQHMARSQIVNQNFNVEFGQAPAHGGAATPRQGEPTTHQSSLSYGSSNNIEEK